MRGLAQVITLVIAGIGLCGCVSADGDLSAIPQDHPVRRASYSAPSLGRPGQDAAPPSGYVAFCDRNPEECRVPRGAPAQLTLTDDIKARLEDVNMAVNRSIRPSDDSMHYGVAEFWTVPIDGYGDCEDYVLAKRKMLMLLGLPEPALRISVVLNIARVRHAVLTVVTDRGELVLDNLKDDIVAPSDTGYVWLERQDPLSRTGWIALN